MSKREEESRRDQKTMKQRKLGRANERAETVFLTFVDRNQFQRTPKYDNSIPTRFLAHIDCSKIPAQEYACLKVRHVVKVFQAGGVKLVKLFV